MILNDSTWDPLTLDWPTIDLGRSIDPAGLSSNSTNMTALFNRGGKILQYHGLADQLIPPFNSFFYYDSVDAWTRTNTRANLSDSVRTLATSCATDWPVSSALGPGHGALSTRPRR